MMHTRWSDDGASSSIAGKGTGREEKKMIETEKEPTEFGALRRAGASESCQAADAAPPKISKHFLFAPPFAGRSKYTPFPGLNKGVICRAFTFQKSKSSIHCIA